MTTALIERPIVDVNPEQLDLVKRTVANGATDAELKLFLFDCQRRGVHPLDKLLHFTKRGGKYTPVTSIDFMRAQAASSGEMAGSDDAIFHPGRLDNGEKHPDEATVTVYRMTQGQRFAYTATARWAEYCPSQGQDHMWRRMPHTMLGKCAEALALRKAFPQQLAGLYAREEMDQAGEPSGYTVTAPAASTTAPATSPEVVSNRVAPSDGESTHRHAGYEATRHGEEIPADGLLYVARVDTTDTKNKNVRKTTVTFSDGTQAGTIKAPLASLAEQWCQERRPVQAKTKETKWGLDLVDLLPVGPRTIADTDGRDADDEDYSAPLSDDDIPF